MSGSSLRPRTRCRWILRQVPEQSALALGRRTAYDTRMSIIPVVAVAALLALTGSILWVGRAVLSNIDHRGPVTDWSNIREGISLLVSRVDANERGIDSLKLAVSDGIERVNRAEQRVQKTVASARRLVAANGLEHAGIEAEAAELAERNDEPEVSEDVPPLQLKLESPRPSGVPGISKQDLESLIVQRRKNASA